MWFSWFLACCLPARQNEHRSDTAIKKRIKKYKLEELQNELEALGVNVDMDADENKKNSKKTQKKLQKLLIRELKQVEQDRIGLEKWTEDAFIVLNDLDTFLDEQLAEMESNEQKIELDSLLDKADSTLGE